MSDTPGNGDSPEGPAPVDGPPEEAAADEIVLPDSPEPTPPAVQPIEIQEEMEQSFLDYAMSVIIARALPDARDGLKPVHRRILWAMHDAGVRPDRSYVKCATVVGDVIGKYHPHGDQAAYFALVRLGQHFSLRHPLIDPHGNFGSPSEEPAAYRYTECRLSPIAMRMLDGIDQDTVDLVANFDGKHSEPTVLPARFPNMLVNGQQGIAVGMATNIPPHNLGEVVAATRHLLEHPDATSEDLMEFVRGPDFPTGGLVMGRRGIRDAYTTGRGSVRVRGRAEIEETATGERIVVTQLPYQTSVEALEMKIAELVERKQLDGIRSLDNASAKGEIRLIVNLKRDAPALVVLNNLYKLTPLQTTFSVNMVALVDGVPRTLSLVEALRAYVDHQIEVVTRRSRYLLDKAQRRAHIVEGLIRALDLIDQIIALIRGSDDRAAAREGLMAEPFSFSEVQADHILDMTLSRLTRLGRSNLEEELGELRIEIADLEAILGDDARLRRVIGDELAAIAEEFATDRRSELAAEDGELDIEDLIDDEELVVTVTADGYVKAVPSGEFRLQGRGGRGVRGTALKDDDLVDHLLTTTAHAYLLFFSNQGKVYRVKAHELPMRERSARGIPIVNLLPLASGERIQAIIDTRDYESGRYLFFATKGGVVKKTRFTDYDSSRRDGLIAINLREGDELVRVVQTNGGDDIFLIAASGQTIRFREDNVRAMGRVASGVKGMRLREGDEVVACAVAREGNELLFITTAGFGKRTPIGQFPRKGRGGLGVRGIRITDERGRVVAAHPVDDEAELLLISSNGVLIRTGAADVSVQGRDATGVRIMHLDDGEEVAAVAPVFPEPEGDEGVLADGVGIEDEDDDREPAPVSGEASGEDTGDGEDATTAD
jgi:DNA gyrase subunit A